MRPGRPCCCAGCWADPGREREGCVGRRVAANRKKLAELEVAQKEQFERQKEEMMGTLKDVGNKVTRRPARPLRAPLA